MKQEIPENPRNNVPCPVYDFVKKYAGSSALRLHMPGHKGIISLGPEPFDITEIPGADSLYGETE